ncbi:hypothetical protein QBC40DRAFT_253011 [Triangularia verruculosa]|uniref:Uncharacterized protein n=1 Tax=Triangularia verruculosa TaxID=2587418 RepID=A0AAN6XJE7_9PEZI|nr:hypothetical protein QBC40DRAFT_253011 [Triangularia verruculosa]
MSSHNKSKPSWSHQIEVRVFSSLDWSTGKFSYYLAPIPLSSDFSGTRREVKAIKKIEEHLTAMQISLDGFQIVDGEVVALPPSSIQGFLKVLGLDGDGEIEEESEAQLQDGDVPQFWHGYVDIPAVTQAERLSSAAVMVEWKGLLGGLKPFPRYKEFKDSCRQRFPGYY